VTQMRLNAGPTPMYAQLSMILRSKITGGEWPAGHEIPTLGELCDQYSVARVTARQAVMILVQDGLLSSQRGRRTFVSFVPPAGNAAPLFNSIGSVQSSRPDYSIRILEQADVDALPENPGLGSASGPYVLLRKIDCESGDPYAYSENYVCKQLFDRLPADALTTTKLSRLIRDKATIADAREWLRVSLADYQEAQYLQCMISAPVARIDRVFCDADDRVIYFGRFIYRGDRFAVEHDITAYIAGPAL